MLYWKLTLVQQIQVLNLSVYQCKDVLIERVRSVWKKTLNEKSHNNEIYSFSLKFNCNFHVLDEMGAEPFFSKPVSTLEGVYFVFFFFLSSILPVEVCGFRNSI